jgi:hypothetical protein
MFTPLVAAALNTFVPRSGQGKIETALSVFHVEGLRRVRELGSFRVAPTTAIDQKLSAHGQKADDRQREGRRLRYARRSE